MVTRTENRHERFPDLHNWVDQVVDNSSYRALFSTEAYWLLEGMLQPRHHLGRLTRIEFAGVDKGTQDVILCGLHFHVTRARGTNTEVVRERSSERLFTCNVS